MQRVLVIALGATAAMGLAAAMVAPGIEAGQDPGGAFAARGRPEAAPQADAPADDGDDAGGGDDAMLLRRDASGQFRLTAQVNGSSIGFLVDTGADVVALSEADAEALGVMPAADQFAPVMQTASGVGYGAPVMLDEVTVGNATFRDVPAVVVRGLTTNLLGQSVLARLGKVELQGDRMIIHH